MQTRCVRLLLATALLLNVVSSPGQSCAGALDRSFNPPGMRDFYQQIYVDGDGAIVSDGFHVLRFRSDGSLDPTFSVSMAGGTGVSVRFLAKDPQGRWMIGGLFGSINRTPRVNLARLLPNGQVDATFSVTSIYLPQLNAIAFDANGRMLVSGGPLSVGYPIYRINPDGSVDSSFHVGSAGSGPIAAIALQSDGKILIGGSFKTFDGVVRHNLARLLPNGLLDSSYTPLPPFPANGIILTEGDDALVFNNAFGYFEGNGDASPPFVRFHKNGEQDTSFAPSIRGNVASVAVQKDGKLLLGGYFSDQFGKTFLKRLLPSGEIDPIFAPFIGGPGYGNGGLVSVALDDQDRILISGFFNTVNGVSCGGIARLLSDAQPCPAALGFERSEYIFDEHPTSISVIRTGDTSARVTAEIQQTIITSEWLADWSDLSMPPNVVFEPGVTRQELPLNLRDDDLLEGTTLFTLTLKNPSANAIVGGIQTTTVTVLDNSSTNVPGTIDLSFRSAPLEQGITDVKITSDDKIMVAGTNRLTRLLADGSVDPTFHSDQVTNLIRQIAFAGDKIYALIWKNAEIVRFNGDGSLDTTFRAPAFAATDVETPWLVGMAALPNGTVAVSGDFPAFGGLPHRSLTYLNIDGSFDTSKPPILLTSVEQYPAYFRVFHVLDDGSILAAGIFEKANGKPRQAVAHLSSDGVLLDDFQLQPMIPWPEALNQVNAIARQANGAVVLAGRFVFNDSGAQNLVRFTANGEFDNSFHPPHDLDYAADFVIAQPDGKIIEAGSNGNVFLKYGAGYYSRLNSDGSMDAFFVSDFGPLPIVFQRNGDLLGRYSSQVARVSQASLVRLKIDAYSGPGVGFIQSYTEAHENDGAKILVHRDWSTKGEVRMRVTTEDNQAKAGVDYVAIDQEIVFADGEGGTKEIQIPLINDDVFKYPRDFYVNLQSATPGFPVLVNRRRASVLIVDDETGFRFEKTRLDVYEGVQMFPVAIQRVGPINGPATVELVAQSGSATLGVDFKMPETQVVTFTNLQTQREIWFEVVNDDIPEGDETFQLILRNPTGGVPVIEPSTNEVTLHDDAAEFAFDRTRVTVNQYDRVARLTVNWSSYNAKPVRLEVKTSGGSALPNVEYVPQDRFIDFVPGTYYQTNIFIPLLPNEISGPPSTIEVTATPLGGEVLFVGGPATIEINHPTKVSPSGSFDPYFQPISRTTNSSILAIAVAGPYLYVSGDLPGGPDFVRLKSDGSIDSTFQPQILKPTAIALAPNGQIFALEDPNPFARTRKFARLNFDGSIDPAFNPQLSEDMRIDGLIPTADGKLIVHGATYVGGMIYRLLPSGAIDETFSNPTFPIAGEVYSAVLQPDGSILAAEAEYALYAYKTNFIRLLPDGRLDASFTTDFARTAIDSIKSTRDGKVLISGSLILSNNTRVSLSRLNADGKIDMSYQSPFTNRVQLLAVDNAARAYVAVSNTLVRLQEDGSIDPDFAWRHSVTAAAVTPNVIYIVSSDSDVPLLSRVYAEAPAAILKTPRLVENGRMVHQFNFPAATPYIFEATTDFQNWISLHSGTTAAGSDIFEMVQPTAPTIFRLRQSP